MTEPFFYRFAEYFSEVGKILRGEADAASIFPNPTDVGTTREKIYAEFLRLHLPSSCNVVFGGFLFDQEGHESKQIDIIIYNDSSLRFNLYNKDGIGKSFSCIDGCVGAFSVKSKLDSRELIDSLENISSIPNKQPIEGKIPPILSIPNYEDWPYKVIYATDGIQLGSILETLENFYKVNNHISINLRPNLIHVSGKYAIVRIGEKGALTRDKTSIPPHTFYGIVEVSDVFALYNVISTIQRNAFASQLIQYDYLEMIDKIPIHNTKIS